MEFVSHRFSAAALDHQMSSQPLPFHCLQHLAEIPLPHRSFSHRLDSATLRNNFSIVVDGYGMFSIFASHIRLLDTPDLSVLIASFRLFATPSAPLRTVAACFAFTLFSYLTGALRFRSTILRSIPDVISADSFLGIYGPLSAFDLATGSLRLSYIWS
jgi:hypothetical protein